MTIKTEIRMVGVLALLFISYSLWMGEIKAQGLPGGYPGAVLALELVSKGADIEAIKSARVGISSEFNEHVNKDLGLIVIYVVFFSCLGFLLAELDPHRTKYLSMAGGGCAVIAGVFDLIENRGMLKAVSTPAGASTDSLANVIRYPSLAKWAFLFVCCLLIGFTISRRVGWMLIPGLAFLIAALLGLSGVILNLMSPKYYWMFPASIPLLGLGLICIFLVFTFWPAKVLNKFFTHP